MRREKRGLRTMCALSCILQGVAGGNPRKSNVFSVPQAPPISTRNVCRLHSRASSCEAQSRSRSWPMQSCRRRRLRRAALPRLRAVEERVLHHLIRQPLHLLLRNLGRVLDHLVQLVAVAAGARPRAPPLRVEPLRCFLQLHRCTRQRTSSPRTRLLVRSCACDRTVRRAAGN